MTTTAPEKPDTDRVPGIIGGARQGHVKNLLARSAAVANTPGLTPTVVRRMRRHYQVASCLIVQSLPLIRADWSIECDDDRIRDALTGAYRAIAFDVHKSATRALWAGRSPNGLRWDYRPDLGILCPVEVRDLDPFTCTPDTDDRGTLAGFTQQILGASEYVDPIYALWITEGLESGNYLGRSILDAALDPWQDYAAFRAFHARYLERFGEPIVIARSPAGTSIVNKDAIEEAVAANASSGAHEGDPGFVPIPLPVIVDNQVAALDLGQNLRHHSVVALPSNLLYTGEGKASSLYSWGLEFLETTGNHGEEFLEAIKETDQRIARAMFVPDLLLNNTSATGSNALGISHRSTWSEAVEGRLDDYSRQITAQVLDPIRLLNYGKSSAGARLVFQPLNDEQVDRWWTLAQTLADGGRLPVDLEELGQRLGIPLVDNPNDAVAAQEAAMRARGPRPVSLGLDVPERPVSSSSGAAGGGWVDLLATDPVAGLPEWKIPQSFNPPPFSRELNTREKRVGFAKIEAGLNAQEAAALAQLDEILSADHDRILRQLTGIVRKGSTAEVLEALATLELKAGPKVTRAWADLMAAVSASAITQLGEELATYAAQLPESLGVEGRALFTGYASTSADRALTSLLTEVRLNLLNAYTSGVSRAGLQAIVGQVFDAYLTSEAKPIRLTTRMLSAKSLNYSRAAAVQRGGIPLAGAQYSAILDRRTCDLCRDLDETVIAIEHTDLARFTPPIHHNCRCLWVWITRDEEDFTPTWVTPAPSKVERFGGLVF